MSPFAAFFFFAVAFFMVMSKSSRKQKERSWADAARELGLEYNPGGVGHGKRLSGQMRGYLVHVELSSKGAGDSHEIRTRYRVQYPSLGLGLELKRATPLAEVAGMLGAERVEIGDPVFDEKVLVRGNDAERIRALLTPPNRLVVRRGLSRYRSLKINDTTVGCYRRDIDTSPKVIISTLEGLCDVADVFARASRDALSGARRDTLAGEHTGTAPWSDGNPLDGTVPPELTPTPPPRSAPGTVAPPPVPPGLVEEASVPIAPAPIVPPVMEPEPPRPEPVEVVVPPVAPEPVTPEPVEPEPVVPQPEATTTAHEPPPAPEPEPATPPTPVAPAQPPLTDAAEACRELFEDTRVSGEVRDRFESDFAGREVRWSGTLTRVDRYSSDPLFGAEPGSKAVVELHEIEDGLGGKRQVSAVVQLPREVGDDLDGRRGETLAFAGRLVGCEPYMRRLMVAEGSLTAATP